MTIEKVIKVLVESGGADPSAIRPESTFAELGLDSLDTVDILMQLEEEFQVTLEMSDKIKTVQDIVQLIEESK